MKLYKRTDAPDAPYYAKFQHEGQRYTKCLETPTPALARKFARRWKDAVVSGAWQARLTPTSRNAASVDQIIECYLRAGLDVKAESRASNVCALRLILRTAGSNALTAAAIGHFFAAAALRVQAADQEKGNRIRRSANSTAVQALSVFTRRAMLAYAAAGLSVADPAPLRAAALDNRFEHLPKPDYHPPARAIIEATLLAWEQLDDRNLFLAVGHALAFGLRRGEIMQLDWSHHRVEDHVPCLIAKIDNKKRENTVIVRALDPFFSTLLTIARARGWWAPSGPVLDGRPAEIRRELWDRLSAWLTGLGWQTLKKAHTLRAYSGSLVAMRYDIYAAQRWLRHSTVKVTEDHYSHYVSTFRPADPSTLPQRWAVAAPAEFVPQILSA